MGTLSVPRSRHAEPRRARRAVLAPEVLKSERILGDPADPVDACRRARTLLRQGALTAARALVTPHTRGSRADPVALELLAAVATSAGARDAAGHLERARAAHERRGDPAGLARLDLLAAEREANAGALRRAHELLARVTAVFTTAGAAPELAASLHLRSEVLLLAGALHEALAACDAALTTTSGVALEARVRLTRARVLAALGHAALATRELVTAAGLLGTSASPADRVRLRLGRAEALLLVGAPRRAADGLRRVLTEAADLEEVPVLARVHATLGDALLERDPAGARRELTRARHLHAGCGGAYGVAACDVGLARAERRLGLDVRRRLEAVPPALLAESPRLAARARLARAELVASTEPARAYAELTAARDDARTRGDVSLTLEATWLFVASGLATAEEAGLTPFAP